jgi:hypothetical protein
MTGFWGQYVNLEQQEYDAEALTSRTRLLVDAV